MAAPNNSPNEKWTIETLKEYFDRILADKDKALRIAEDTAEKWRASANEWRGAMSDRERQFLTKDEFNEYKRSMEKALALEKERGDKLEGRGIGIQQFIGWIIAAIAIAGFIISISVKK